jgi:hypothetical protein
MSFPRSCFLAFFPAFFFDAFFGIDFLGFAPFFAFFFGVATFAIDFAAFFREAGARFATAFLARFGNSFYLQSRQGRLQL